MTRGWGLVVAAAAILAALLIVPRLWAPEPAASERSPRRLPGGGGASESSDTRTGRERSGAESADVGSVGGSRRGSGSADRPQRDGGTGTAAGRDARGMDVASPNRGPGHDGTFPDHIARPAPAASGDRRLPDRNSGAGSPEMDANGEPFPEVAYQGGAEHVFDIGSQTELSDAGAISGDAGTVAFWVKPEWKANNQDDAVFVQFGDSGLQVTKNVNFLRFEYIDPKTGAEYGVGTNIGDWHEGDLRHVTATWTGTSLALYVDGKLVSENRFPNPPDFQQDTHIAVGTSFPSGAPAAPGQLSYVTVLNRGTSGPEVTEWYSSGPRPR